MSLQLTEVTVRNLHGFKTVRLPVRDNRVVLVGANGVGKTTVMNILSLVISRQWHRLLDYDFSEVMLDFGVQLFYLPKSALVANSLRDNLKDEMLRVLPRPVAEKLRRQPGLLRRLDDFRGDPSEIDTLAERLGIATSSMTVLLEQYFSQQQSLEDEVAPLRQLSEYLESTLNARVLYLPTYRRIERDLKMIFPGLEADISLYNLERTKQEAGPAAAFLELVEFGMDDVEQTFRRTLTDLERTARTELHSLAGGYLRDVIRGQAGEYRPEVIEALDGEAVTRVLDRVEEHALDEADKESLRGSLERIKRVSPEEITPRDRYVAHFLEKLVVVHEALVAREQAVRGFLRVCSGYLGRDKALVYDERGYRIEIRHESGQTIGLRALSSGEKQIVSLFSHLYLESAPAFVVLIDEPELSLSVDWQLRLLPDIWNSGRCLFLAAATHSPQIFENEFDDYTLDLSEYTEFSGEGEG